MDKRTETHLKRPVSTKPYSDNNMAFHIDERNPLLGYWEETRIMFQKYCPETTPFYEKQPKKLKNLQIAKNYETLPSFSEKDK